MHFFSIFTGIFVVMTVIILQVMRVGLYSDTENGLLFAKTNTHFYVTRELLRNGQENLLSLKNRENDLPPLAGNLQNVTKMVENTDIILYNTEGGVLNQLPPYSSLTGLALDTTDLNTIKSHRLTNYFGQIETYKSITVPVSYDGIAEIAYATIAINTTQIADTNRYVITIIISVMTLFWLISIFASLYLANWSSRPILETVEKQKAFVENASHELRTPLAVLQNRLENLLRKPDSTVLDNSETIVSSLDEVRNMRRLTTHLLHLARRDDGIRLELTEVDDLFFKGIFANYELIATEHHKGFSSQVLLAQPVTSDKLLLKQLLTIFFDNAIKYTGEDGQVAITVQTREKHLILTIADNGSGIRQEDKQKIFDRFYRVDKARTRQNGGFGLGLSLAKQIVDRLGGRITVEDNLPKGTVFRITL